MLLNVIIYSSTDENCHVLLLKYTVSQKTSHLSVAIALRHYTAKACAYLCQHHLRRHAGVGEFGEFGEFGF